jgi:dTDP-4-dehydrorhamnose 3,5-epimerase
MIFSETPLRGAYIIDPERIDDARGFFARTWCQHEYEARGLTARVAQCSISFNKVRGTLRGLHYQTGSRSEAKLVRCTVGAVYDVIVDLRAHSPTFRHHFGVVLDAQDRRMLFAGEGFAHGFQTLEDATEVFYQISEFYAPEHAAGVRWNDPAFGITWPLPPTVMSERDRTYRDFAS